MLFRPHKGSLEQLDEGAPGVEAERAGVRVPQVVATNAGVDIIVLHPIESIFGFDGGGVCGYCACGGVGCGRGSGLGRGSHERGGLLRRWLARFGLVDVFHRRFRRHLCCFCFFFLGFFGFLGQVCVGQILGLVVGFR